MFFKSEKVILGALASLASIILGLMSYVRILVNSVTYPLKNIDWSLLVFRPAYVIRGEILPGVWTLDWFQLGLAFLGLTIMMIVQQRKRIPKQEDSIESSQCKGSFSAAPFFIYNSKIEFNQ